MAWSPEQIQWLRRHIEETGCSLQEAKLAAEAAHPEWVAEWEAKAAAQEATTAEIKEALALGRQLEREASQQPVEGLDNTDVVETWNLTVPEEAAHFGLPWNDAGYVLVLLNQRKTGAHATLVGDNASMTADFRSGWPTDWPEHNQSNCAGHGAN